MTILSESLSLPSACRDIVPRFVYILENSAVTRRVRKPLARSLSQLLQLPALPAITYHLSNSTYPLSTPAYTMSNIMRIWQNLREATSNSSLDARGDNNKSNPSVDLTWSWRKTTNCQWWLARIPHDKSWQRSPGKARADTGAIAADLGRKEKMFFGARPNFSQD